MSSFLKLCFKALAILVLLLGTLSSVMGVLGYYYRDQIVKKLFYAANKQLGNTLQAATIQLTCFQPFPHMGFVLHHVVVKDRSDMARNLLTVRKMHCAFHLRPLLQGKYDLAHLTIESGTLHVDPYLGSQLAGTIGTLKVEQHTAPLTVKPQQVTLKDIKIVHGTAQSYTMLGTMNMHVRLTWSPNSLTADLQGDALMQYAPLRGEEALLQKTPAALQALLHYDALQRNWTLTAMKLHHPCASLTAQGSWHPENLSSIVLTLQGDHIQLPILVACLNKYGYQTSKAYGLDGSLALWFHIEARKQPYNNQWGILQGNFTIKDGVVTIQPLTQPVTLTRLSGHFEVPDVGNLTTALLRIDEIAVALARNNCTGSLLVRNFLDPYLQCTAQATLNWNTVHELGIRLPLTDTTGHMDFHGNLKAYPRQFMQGMSVEDTFSLEAALNMKEINGKMPLLPFTCRGLSGKLIFQDNLVVVQDLTGRLGEGNFMLKGTLENLLPCVLTNHPTLLASGKFYTDYLDMNVLLDDQDTISVFQLPQGLSKLMIMPDWTLDLDCDVQQLRYRRLQAKNVRGKIQYKDQKISTEKLQLGFAGGKVLLCGMCNALVEDRRNIRTSMKLKSTSIAGLFYVFENFHQQFLMDRHLDGELFADVALTIQADKRWHIDWNTLQADLAFRLMNGVVRDFPPIQQLAKQMVKQQLPTTLRFSEIKNRMSIKDRIIHVPPMEIQSNGIHIQLSGMHTFDGDITYKVGIPLTGFDVNAHDAGVHEDSIQTLASVNLFFTLQGNTHHYTIRHDAAASRRSFKQALQAQGQAFKSLIKGVYQNNPRLKELDLDDYFDFDE